MTSCITPLSVTATIIIEIPRSPTAKVLPNLSLDYGTTSAFRPYRCNGAEQYLGEVLKDYFGHKIIFRPDIELEREACEL
jgi:hypothetical protein